MENQNAEALYLSLWNNEEAQRQSDAEAQFISSLKLIDINAEIEEAREE